MSRAIVEELYIDLVDMYLDFVCDFYIPNDLTDELYEFILDVEKDLNQTPYYKVYKYSDSQPRDDHGRWTDGGGSSGSGFISGATSGALNPFSKEAQEHADRYYESVRHMKTDTKKISDATGIKKDKIDKIKQHVFIKEHDLFDGHRRFDSSYDMALSWQRLIQGKSIQKKDIVLLKHEYMELRYMEKGFTQDEAHIKASKRYNYAKYCE